MRMAVLSILVASAFIPTAAAAGEDLKGTKDPALFTRMPGFFISDYSCTAFASEKYSDEKGKERAQEGRVCQFDYRPNEGVEPGPLAVRRNYTNAAQKLGAKVTFEAAGDKGESHFVVRSGGKETWVKVYAPGYTWYRLIILEREEMVQSVVANPEALASGLAATGHVALGGIFFDTGKADLKPESDAAIAEVVKLLQRDATLKVHVVGHTDNVGDPASNLKLSQERAAAVVKAFVTRHHIAESRLGFFGAGPYSPVASNDSDAGRASNRRVELVKQ